MNKLFFLILLSFVLTQNCLALSSDKNKPIELEADSADIDDQNGISIYRGKVILTQGSTQLNAQKLTIYHDKNHKLIKIVAEGSPARYKQTPDGQKKDVKAKASKLIYYSKKDLIHLYDNALLWQGKNSFRGDKIIYDTKRDIVKASSKKTSDGKVISSGRVKVTILPEKK
ncbi:MAG: lipopolysaccharide transport periplasmic protein LptA [Pseudomonadota bacterium]